MGTFPKNIFVVFVLLLLFANSSLAQVRFIDNKGTLNTINGTASSPNSTITLTGTPANSLFKSVGFDITPAFTFVTKKVLITNTSGNVEWVTRTSLEHTGTTGSVFFADAVTGAPTENNAQFFWDATNNRLGIGTNTPTHKLQVVGQVRATSMANADGTAGSPAYRFWNDASTGMFRPAADQLGFATGGSEAFRIDASQNIGIGTTTPNEKLEVNGKVRISDLTGTDLGTDVVVTADATTGELKEGGTIASIVSDNETVTSITQATGNTDSDVTSGDANTIATYTNEDGDDKTINETVTTLEKSTTDSLEYKYTNEAGTEVVFRSSPIVAFGKVNSSGTLLRGYGATVSRNSRGNYTITLTTARSTANYTIQLTVRDSNGAGNDDYDLAYSGQTTSSFVVEVGDNDNGKSNRAKRDFEFMFTVIDY